MPHTAVKLPLVSISCITYNQAKYIRQCLDGFLMQETKFPFEILIHDDASTDGTEEIIKEYHALHPSIIKPLYEAENQWVKGRKGSAVFNFPRAKGKYIALCEGDDYWTSPSKLQQQISFLEKHPDFAGSCSDTHIVDAAGNKISLPDVFVDYGEKVDLNFNDVVTSQTPFHTASFVFRREVIDHLPAWFLNAPYADRPLIYLTAKMGEIRRIPEMLSAYRKHPGGVTQNSSGLAYTLIFLRFNYMLKRYFAPQGAAEFNEMLRLREKNIIGCVAGSICFKEYVTVTAFFTQHLRFIALGSLLLRLLRVGFTKGRNMVGRFIPSKMKDRLSSR